MKLNCILFLTIGILTISCGTEVNNEEILKCIQEKDVEQIESMFYKPKRLKNHALSETISEYAIDIEKRKLKTIVWKDSWSFKKRDKEGYLFIDDNNNIVHSITWKYTKLKDGSKKINYIDFRNSERKFQSLKFPSHAPLKSVLKPKTKPLNSDSLINIYPIMKYGYKFYHSQLLGDKFLDQGDTLKNAIVFNVGNKNIADNFEQILKDIDKELGINNYTLAVYESYGEPTTNITYNPSEYNTSETSTIKNILEKNQNGPLRLNAVKVKDLTFGSTATILSIGGVFSETRKLNPYHRK